jgi:tetratricopeptide (TPR) repeat protein
MPHLKQPHLDEFELLRHAAGELADEERRIADHHLEGCGHCRRRMAEMSRLNVQLKAAAAGDASPAELDPMDLPAGDPFRFRPLPPDESLRPGRGADRLAAPALRASEEAGGTRDGLLAASRDLSFLPQVVADLSLRDLATRYGVLYALQESGREIAGGPMRSLRFAELVLEKLRRERPESPAEEDEVGRIVPLLHLRGQAHLLAGQACNWTRQFERAKTHLTLAYRCFARSGGDEVGLAIVEHVEAQRRSMLDRGAEALVLARRARSSFQMLGIEDLAAKADVAVGSALTGLGRGEEAVPLFSSALKVFERRGIWSNYVGTLNNLASCLQQLGRLDEARREYARALRRLSPERDGSFVASIRHGLAEVLFSAERYREAANSFSQAARLYAEIGLPARALTVSLFEIESWARSGDFSRAKHRLDIFQSKVVQLGALDSRVVREIESALAGENPDLERLAALRGQAQRIVEERLNLSTA